MTVSEALEPLTVGDFIAADARIGDLLPALAVQPILFVLDGRDIGGIVTPSDLNKQAARAHFYVLITSVEMGLSEALRRRYRKQAEVLSLLVPHRRECVEARYQRDRDDDVEADIIAELELVDLFTAAAKTPELCAHMDWPAAKLQRLQGRTVDLRNDVMHPARVVRAVRKPDKLNRMERDLVELIESLSRLPRRFRRLAAVGGSSSSHR